MFTKLVVSVAVVLAALITFTGCARVFVDETGCGGSGGAEASTSSSSSSSSGSSSSSSGKPLCLTHEDCADTDPCTQDLCNFGNGSCVNFAVVGCQPAFCILNTCCEAGQCVDSASGQCVDECPKGLACVKLLCQ